MGQQQRTPVAGREDLAHLKSQVILCKGGCGGVIAACHVPECYQETDWMRDVRNYAKKGYRIEVLTHDLWNWGCTCAKAEPAPVDPNLFSNLPS